MRIKFFLLFFVLILVVLYGCKKAECAADADCLKQHFTSSCVEKKCVYTPIPGECGNGICEDPETKCTCAEDCGICMGPSGPFELVCVGKMCLEGIPDSKIKPAVSADELSAAGDKLRVTAEYNQPFNMLKDLFNVRISLASASPNNEDRKISRIVLVGEINRQTIPLAEMELNRLLWPGSDISAGLVVDFPTAEKSGTITNLEIQITYDYLTGTAAKSPKSTVLKNKYTGIKFEWVKPSTPYPCPENCDDANPGTQDVCDASTRFFCEHRPVPGVCGNYVCDANENPCICPADCGLCAGGGMYFVYSCADNACTAQLKPGIVQETQSLFDDRALGPLHLQNNYEFKNPFNTAQDKIKLNFNLYDKKDAGNIKITAVRLFEGTNEISSSTPNLVLPDVGSKGIVELSIPAQASPEESKALSIKVWYEYDQAGEAKKNSYSKTLDKITLLSPGLPK